MASMFHASFPLVSSVVAVRRSKNRSNDVKVESQRKMLLGSNVTKASLYKTQKIQNDIKKHPQHNLKDQHHRIIGVGSTSEECARSFVVNAAVSGESFESEPQDHIPTSKSFWGSIKYSFDVFYRFSRAYVLITTVISIISLSLIAVENLSDISPAFFIGLLQALVAALAMNVYVAGLNQLTDIEIDKINKPYLPLASGEYSFRTGVIIVASCLVLSLGVGWIVGSPPLFWGLFTFFMLGTAYSIDLPMLRWKRSPVLAAMYSIAVRGLMFPFAFFLHMQTYVFKRATMIPRSLIFASAFMSVFAVVMIWVKDLPDVEGDEKFGIKSLAVCLGQKQVFWICISLLEMAYGVGIIVGARSSYLSCKLITVLGHALLALLLLYRSKSVDFKSKSSLQSFFMFIMKLCSAEYFIIPFMK